MTNILIVDDYLVSHRVLGHILRHGGYAVVTAENGAEALDVLAQEAIDLILLDIAMPVMDGLTLLRHLRADARYATLPVIMLTASGQEADRRAAEAIGANGFLTKPASSGELLDTVQRVLSINDY